MMVVVMVVMMTMSRGNDDNTAPVGVVMVVVMMELHLLNVFIGAGHRTGIIDRLQQRHRIWNRFKQVRK